MLGCSTSQGRCCLVHAGNTEEEQTLKQSTINYCIQ